MSSQRVVVLSMVVIVYEMGLTRILG